MTLAAIPLLSIYIYIERERERERDRQRDRQTDRQTDRFIVISTNDL